MTSRDVDSLELVRSAKNGDLRALDELFARYYERIRKVVRARLGVKLRELVDSGDILQETFAAALQAFDRFEPRDEASLVHWLSKIAEHAIQDAAAYWRRQKRNAARRVPLEVVSGESDRLPAGGAGPLTQLAAREELSLAERCLGELPDPYREVIVLRKIVGADWAFIAKELGRPSPDAARMLYGTALARLDRAMRRRVRRNPSSRCDHVTP